MSRFANALHSTVPRPCYGRPFVCDGLAEKCVALVIGENPATEVGIDWWSYWDDATGFQFSKWRSDYKKSRGERGASNTRLRLDRLRLRGVRCLETNVFANERPDGPGIGMSNDSLLHIALETLPNISFVIAHGDTAKDYVRSQAFPSHIREVFELRHFRIESYANIDRVANEILAEGETIKIHTDAAQ